MININDKENKQQLIVLNADDLEEVVRNVVGELLTEQKQAQTDAKLAKAVVRERLHVDDSTLWRWDKAGYLKAIHIGRSVYYRESDVLKIEEGRI